MTRLKKIVYLVLLVGGLPSALASAIQDYRLENGLKLIVKEDHRAPIVSSQVWYKVGASYEPAGKTGISHVLEHMMFRGSRHYSSDTLFRLIERNGGIQNAFTTEDFTVYYQELPADKLALSFALEADRMHQLSLRQKDFLKEIQVVREERRMQVDDNPQATLWECLTAAALMNSPYQHPVIGWSSDLQRMAILDLRRWYQRWYGPNNAILVVVGDVQAQQVYRLAQRYFGPLQPINIPHVPQTKLQSLKPRERSIIVKRPAQLPSLIMAYDAPTLASDPKSNDPYSLALIATLLTGGESARLEKGLVRKQQLATTVNAYYDPFTRLPNLWSIEATPISGHTVTELQTALQDQINQLQTKDISSRELARAKAQILSSLIYQRDSITTQGYEIGRLEAVGLSWRILDQYAQRIQAITIQQIRAAAQQYLTSEHLTVAHLEPLPLYKKPHHVKSL